MTSAQPDLLKAREERVPVTLLATVGADASGRLHTCVIEDYNESGAKLVFPSAPVLASPLRVTILRLGCTYLAQVRWQDGQTVGISFDAQLS
ncbi:MAG TPA: PilZ domain-containing protein [Microvirga sp.]|jgi:hypothetical protein